MTGYGYASRETDKFLFSCEVKSLNSKGGIDLSLRLPRTYSDKELEVRNLAGKVLDRGKVSIYVDAQMKPGAAPVGDVLDVAGITQRYLAMKKLSDALGVVVAESELLAIALRSQGSGREREQPSEIQQKQDDEATEYKTLLAVIEEALANADAFREQEGRLLEGKLVEYCHNIRKGLDGVVALDPARLPRIRQRLEDKLADLKDAKFDQNRLEQEMILYIERLDIAEEVVRLTNHLDLLDRTLTDMPLAGKKINFMTQEVGREINTIGSKANDSQIQQQVVAMKEALEQIKEQAANLL